MITFTMFSCNKVVKESINLQLQGDTRESNLKSSSYPILDLKIDPVVSTGVSAEYAITLENAGFQLLELPENLIVDEQFLDSEGEFYIIRGIILKGTLMWVPDGDWSAMKEGDNGVTQSCSNIYAL